LAQVLGVIIALSMVLFLIAPLFTAGTTPSNPTATPPAPTRTPTPGPTATVVPSATPGAAIAPTPTTAN